MTALDTEATTAPSGDELHQLLVQLDPSILVNCLVQMTGDTTVLDRYASAFTPTALRNITTSHEVTPEAVDAIAEEIAARLGTWDPERDTLTALDLPLLQQLASFMVGEHVADEFVPLLEEQAGFVHSRRVIPVTRKPPPDFKVIVIGAGMVGINAGVKLGEAGFSYQIFESRSEVGGTWSINRYPGAAVDTPSHYYSYSFELNPEWSHFYPVGDEYFTYLTEVADKYGVTPNISFDTSVVSCDWDEARQRWLVRTVCNGETTEHEANAVITALGFLNRPITPDIPGEDTFRGLIMHAAAWDRSVDLTGKHVVVLGAGCTAVQVATDIADQVASLTVVQRQPHWVAPAKAGAGQGEVPAPLGWALRNIPGYHQWYRLKTYWYASDGNYLTPRIDPEWQKTHAVSVSEPNDRLMQLCLAHLDQCFGDRPELREQLTPTFPPYARRIIRDPGYYETLRKDHVGVVTGTIEKFEPDGVIAGGQKLPCDVVVFATGFAIDMLASIGVTGRGGRTLAETWGDDPRGYLGVLVPGFPNLFTTAGPNSAPNHGGGHNLASEEQVHYIIECLQLLLERDASALEATQTATDEYNARVDVELDRTVWQHGGTANGYYRNSKGRAWLACPWRMVDYWTMLRAPDTDHLVLTPQPRALDKG